MTRMEFLKMKTDRVGVDLMDQDLRELVMAARKLVRHAVSAGRPGIGTSILKFGATVAAIYLLILDRTNWRSNMLTSLLVPHTFFSLPNVIFNAIRGEFGKWVALFVVILRLSIPQHFPDWLELLGALILILVVSPSFFAHTLRESVGCVIICLAIVVYLLQEHIRATDIFRDSFTQRHGISNTVGILALLVYPLWRLISTVV